MNDFEILQNLSMGQYRPGSSPVHSLNPAVKLGALILGMVMVFLSPLFPQLPVLFFLLFLVVKLSGLKLGRLLRGIRPVLPFLFFIALIQMFLISRAHDSEALFKVFRFSVYPEDLLFTARLFGRFFCLFLLFTLFTSVTTVSEISHGAEILSRPVSGKSGLSHDVSLVITITFRFIPLLALEAEHITKAQASRGGSFGTWKMGLVKKVRLYIPLLVPLFVAALERAEILVEAMEARCYEPGRERSRLAEYPWTGNDSAALCLVVTVFILLLVSRFFIWNGIIKIGGFYV